MKSWPRWNSNRVPLDPKSQSFQLSHKALDESRWLKRLFVFFSRLSSELKAQMDCLYVLEDSVKSLFWKNSKPIRSCVLGSTSHRNLRALPSRSALGCASGTTLGQRAQVSMLGRTSDAASNINVSTLQSQNTRSSSVSACWNSQHNINLVYQTNKRGSVTIFSDSLRFFLGEQTMATARANVADIGPWQLGQPREHLHRPC